MIGDITHSEIFGKKIFFESSNRFFGVLSAQTSDILWIKEKSGQSDQIFVNQ